MIDDEEILLATTLQACVSTDRIPQSMLLWQINRTASHPSWKIKSVMRYSSWIFVGLLYCVTRYSTYANKEFDHAAADPSRPYWAIHELILEIHGDQKNFHSLHQLPKTFHRLIDPHTSRHLWWFVNKTCQETWNRVPITEHHTAATVNIHKYQLRCWAGYKDNDVVKWEKHPWDVTFIRDKEALGIAPKAYWYTSKFNTSDHPLPPAESQKTEL